MWGVKISVIVPAFNEEKLIVGTLQCIREAQAAFTARGWASELIVCDNNSTDHTAARARIQGATVVFEPVNQISRARNRGAAAASGDWLIFVDADSQPSRALFGDVAECIQAGGCLAGGAVVQLDQPEHWAVFWNRMWNWISRTLKWVVILTRHPLLTSARKVRLYTAGEIGLFLWRSVVSRGRIFRDRSACTPWYDGRR